MTRAPERGQRRLTVRDIARAAGVSVATVSRAFARPSDVSTETRQRVLKVADQLGYRFNSLAVDFRRGRSRTVVVLVGDITNPFFSEFYKGIEEEARLKDYIALMGDTNDDAASEDRYVDLLSSGRADGLIVNLGTYPQRLTDEFAGKVVTCNRFDGLDVPLVTIDFRGGGRMAGEHLADLGHSRIAELCGPLDVPALRDRHEGFRDALAAHGVTFDPAMVTEGALGIPYGVEAANRLLDLPTPPTAIFTHNDETAMGVLHALSVRGVRVPEDISVVGYDDLAFAYALLPALTTIRLPRRAWGRAACRAVLELIETGTMTPTAPMETEFILRSSTAAPGGAATAGGMRA